MTITDHDLLAAFVQSRDEQAFAQLVVRYTPLVYAAAIRQSRDLHRAEDITQVVFILLARKAARIRADRPLVVWLYATTHLVSRNARKLEARRQHYEAKVAAMSPTITDPDSASDVLPLLDRLMAHLGESDRQILLLRYFQGLSMRETAAALAITQDTAAMRLSRAVARLRDAFSRRGVRTSAEALTTVLVTAVAMVPPKSLAASATTSALAAPMTGPIAALVHASIGARLPVKVMLFAGVAAALLIVMAIVFGHLPGAPQTPAIGSSSATARALQTITIAVYPETSIIRSLADLRCFADATVFDTRDAAGTTWEFRSTDNARRIATIPMPWPPVFAPPATNSATNAGIQQNNVFPLTSAQIRVIGDLADGDYLFAWNVADQRRSNVVRFTINSRHDLATEPPLRLLQFEPPPGQTLPLLVASAVRRTDADPAPFSAAIASSTLILNDTPSVPKAATWLGPDAPLAVGRHYTHLLRWSTYGLTPDLTRKNTLAIRAGGVLSDSITLLTDTPLATAWDKATAVLGPATQPRPALSGVITDPAGKPANAYEVTLSRDALNFQETTDKTGRFAFIGIPAGDYALVCNPIGRGSPTLTITKLTVPAQKPLDITLAGMFTIAGRVTNSDGTPAAGKEIDSTWISPDGTRQFSTLATTDAQGRYTLSSPYAKADYVGLSGAGPQPTPYRNIEAPRDTLNFRLPAR